MRHPAEVTSFVLLTCMLVAASGCRRSKTDASADAGVVASATVAVAPPPTANTPHEEVAADGGVAQSGEDELVDAGADAGRRRRRRASADADAAAPAVADGPAPPPASAEPPPGARGAKTTMGDDRPWGAAPGSSSSAVLKKRPLPTDDPWH